MTKPQLSSLANFNSASNIVKSETINFDANLFRVGLPLATAESGTVNLGFLSKRKLILIAGSFNDTESNRAAFIAEIDGASNVASQSSRTYTSIQNQTSTVKINGYTIISTDVTQNTLDWTMELWVE